MSFGAFVKRLDFYEEPVSMRFNGQAAYRTYLGSCITIMILAITFLHGAQLVSESFLG